MIGLMMGEFHRNRDVLVLVGFKRQVCLMYIVNLLPASLSFLCKAVSEHRS